MACIIRSLMGGPKEVVHGGALPPVGGVDPLIAAECLPAIEAVMVRKLNEQMAAERGRCDEGQGLIFSTNVTPGNPSKCASQVIRSALCVRAVENTMASAVANLCARQTSAAASAISVSSGTI